MPPFGLRTFPVGGRRAPPRTFGSHWVGLDLVTGCRTFPVRYSFYIRTCFSSAVRVGRFHCWFAFRSDARALIPLTFCLNLHLPLHVWTGLPSVCTHLPFMHLLRLVLPHIYHSSFCYTTTYCGSGFGAACGFYFLPPLYTAHLSVLPLRLTVVHGAAHLYLPHA
jgi:hypothetical protein